jgi:hypothetical protein
MHRIQCAVSLYDQECQAYLVHIAPWVKWMPSHRIWSAIQAYVRTLLMWASRTPTYRIQCTLSLYN